MAQGSPLDDRGRRQPTAEGGSGSTPAISRKGAHMAMDSSNRATGQPTSASGEPVRGAASGSRQLPMAESTTHGGKGAMRGRSSQAEERTRREAPQKRACERQETCKQKWTGFKQRPAALLPRATPTTSADIGPRRPPTADRVPRSPPCTRRRQPCNRLRLRRETQEEQVRGAGLRRIAAGSEDGDHMHRMHLSFPYPTLPEYRHALVRQLPEALEK